MMKSANPAVVPVPNVQNDDYDWNARRIEKRALASSRSHDLIFLGDSITHRFERHDGGLDVWEARYRRLGALNLGYGWDCTQNVLWRLHHGEFEGQRPKLVVLNIGTNNLTGNGACRPCTAAEIVEGIAGICRFVRQASPLTRILVMALFPRGKTDEMIHARVKDLNAALGAWVSAEPGLMHLDIGARFLGADGEVDARLMPDRTHPVKSGYEIWADAIEPLSTRMIVV